MTEIINFADGFYYPPNHLQKGLEALVRFPDGDVKSKHIPNSTVWKYDAQNHTYIPEILGSDIGCGIAAFFISEVDPRAAADILFRLLHGKGIIGRGNHFVDICSAFSSSSDSINYPPHNILILHTHGRENKVPTSITDAKEQQDFAKRFREELGEELAHKIGSSKCRMLGNWTHNSVEETNSAVIYRKGVVKVTPEKVYILPAHIGARIVFYTISDQQGFQMPPYDSMMHATGRKGPIRQTKVSLEQVAAMRHDPAIPYIPPGISDSALRTEHPSCFHDYEQIFEKLKYRLQKSKHGLEETYCMLVGSCIIKGYVGKV